MSERGCGWASLLFLVAGLSMFFETNRVVGFRAEIVVPWLFLSLVFCALGLYALKRWSRLLYGVAELLFGAAITFVAINAYGAAQSREYVPIVGGGLFHRSPVGVLQLSEAQIALFGMLAAIYVLVRGFDDVGDGLRAYPKADACWQRFFGSRRRRWLALWCVSALKGTQTVERKMPSFLLDTYAPYRPFLDNGQFRYCIESAIQLLDGLKGFAPPDYQAAHKGTPFYVMGYAAFASHDYPTASLFFDAAVAEDLLNNPGRQDVAAILFMELSDNLPNGTPVLGTQIVAQIKADANVLIADYNARAGARQVTLDELRTFFLRPIINSGQPHTRTLVTALISFIAEWRYRATLIALFEHGSREPFFLHLLRGCVLFESLLKGQTRKALTRNTLGEILRTDLLAELGIANVQVGANDFNAVVAGLGPNMSIEATINSTAQARNTLGHNLVWMVADLNANTYDLLMKNIASACLHAVSTLYR